MNYIGSKQIETERLILKSQTMQEQKRLWEILMIPEVNKYYLTVPAKFREQLLNWDKQEEYYKLSMEHANDLNIFRWSIFLKETGECIGRISCHERHDEEESIVNHSIRGVGWYIDPIYQGNGYATEAATAMIDYMFEEANISEIITSAAILNPASWLIMEKLGFIRQNKRRMIQYTYLDEPVENYLYDMTKERWLNFKNQENIKR
mgnify:CR=1 FL=1